MHSLNALFLYGVLFVLMSTGRESAQGDPTKLAGWVVEVHGTWVSPVDSTNRIGPGQAMFVGDQVASSSAKASIVIALLNGSVLRRECSSKTQCLQPLIVPEIHPPDKGWRSRLIEALSRFFSKEHPDIIVAMSRGDDVVLHEAVLQFRRNHIDLSPAIVKNRCGVCRVEIRPIRGESAAEPLQFELTVGPQPSIELPDRAGMGLYRLSILNTKGSSVAAPVVVLFVDEARYPAVAAQFSEAQDMVRSWLNSEEEAARYFLIASLFALEREVTGQDRVQ